MFDDEARAKLSWDFGLPCHVALGDRVGSAGKRGSDLKFVHVNMFRSWGSKWPVDRAASQTPSELLPEGTSS